MSEEISRPRRITGQALTGLTIVFLLFDAFGKFARPAPVVDALARLDIPISAALTIGSILLVCTILYAIPQTAVLGAVLLTGYLGGAVAIHLRAGSTAFEQVFPLIVGAMVWGGIYLREPRLRDVIPTRH
ncbi:MAG: DoxX family protein [Polyangiaceae bacterium]